MIDNAAIKKKIEAAASRAGFDNAGVIGFIQSTTKNAPYFLDFLRRALPDGSDAALPKSAAKDFDDWVKAMHAKSTTAGSKSAQAISKLLVSSKRSAGSRKPAAAPKPSREAARKQVEQAARAAAPKPASSRKAAPKKSASKPAARKATPKKSAPKKPTTRKAAPKRKAPQQAAAEAVVDRTVKAAVADARRKGIKGPLKITFDLVVERI
jgi:hypothetical protein